MEAKHAIFPSLVTHSSPNHHKSRRNVTRKCCFTTSRRVSSPFLGTKLRGNVLFAVQPLSLEAPTLKQSTCARMRAYYKIFFLESPQMLSPMIRRLAHTKAVKIAVIRKLVSLRNRCTYSQQSTRKEENFKFIKSRYRSRPFCEVLQNNFCRR